MEGASLVGSFRAGAGLPRLVTPVVLVAMLASLACTPAAPAPPPASDKAAAASPAAKEVPPSLKGVAKDKKIVPFLTAESSPESVKQITEIIAEFEKANPGVGIELQLTSNDNRISRIINAVSVGEELGIFEIPRAIVPDLTRAGYLLQLDSIVDEIGIDKFVPGSLLYWPWDGHLYQFTSDLSAATLWYRKDLFQAAGLGEPDSYERILEASQKLHNQGGISGTPSRPRTARCTPASSRSCGRTAGTSIRRTAAWRSTGPGPSRPSRTSPP